LQQEPVFTETKQIGIVVRDLDATIRRYEDDFGIGPWQTFEFGPGDISDAREHGQPVERSSRIAVTTIGNVMWELIEPVDEEGVFADFLAGKGEGVHHIALETRDFDEAVAIGTKEEETALTLSGKVGGIRIAYLPTDRTLGVLTEIFDGMPDGDAAPDDEAPRVELVGVARRLVEGANQAHLATVLPDGAPYSVPLWVGLEGDDVAFLTGPKSRKARNIDRDARVAISITDREQPFTMAQIRGRVIRRLEGDEAWAIVDRIAHKYVGAAYPREQERVVFIVRPEHVQSTEYA
jgi:PPOX class probable F420-dependent enzyme